jgi:hypothetical protein
MAIHPRRVAALQRLVPARRRAWIVFPAGTRRRIGLARGRRLQQRQAELEVGGGRFCASAVRGGTRPSGGSTISDVRRPVRFIDMNTEL